MEFDEGHQACAIRRVALFGGLAVAIGWFGLLSALAQATGRPFWPDVVWTLAGAVLAGRIAGAVVRRLLVWQWGPTEVEVALAEPQVFRSLLDRRLGWWAYRPLKARFDGQGWLPHARLIGLLPPLLLEYHGRGVRLRGPRLLVRMAVRLAVP